MFFYAFKNIIVISKMKRGLTKEVRRKKTRHTWQLKSNVHPGVDPGLGENAMEDLIGALGASGIIFYR